MLPVVFIYLVSKYYNEKERLERLLIIAYERKVNIDEEEEVVSKFATQSTLLLKNLTFSSLKFKRSLYQMSNHSARKNLVVLVKRVEGDF